MPAKGVQHADLKQVKDAIAEAHNQHAGGSVEIHSCDFGPSLVEEVLCS